MKGCDKLNCLNNGVCINKTETEAAYCDCSGIGYNGNVCENDINECLTNNGGCDSNAICTNIQGSFNCTCQKGYLGDGMNCTGIFSFFFSNIYTIQETVLILLIIIDINECSTSNGGCHDQGICTNNPGSFSCTCKPEYSGNGFNCSGIDFFFFQSK